MKIEISKDAKKFLTKISSNEKEIVLAKIQLLINYIKQNNLIPFNIMDIKALTGDWKGALRLRTGKIRILFEFDVEENTMRIINIGYRGNIY